MVLNSGYLGFRVFRAITEGSWGGSDQTQGSRV